jgi:hypothetical protein
MNIKIGRGIMRSLSRLIDLVGGIFAIAIVLGYISHEWIILVAILLLCGFVCRIKIHKDEKYNRRL